MIFIVGVITGYEGMTDEELLAAEERMYDEEVEGHGNWHDRDMLLWEINRRDTLKRPRFQPTGK